MSKRNIRAILIALSSLSVLFISCRARIVEAPGLSEPEATATATPTLPPTRTPTSALPIPETPTSTQSPDATQPSPAESGATTHTVQSGDTLLGIATEHGVPMAAIQLENDMGDSTVVQTGQVLSIPSRDGWEEASRFWVVHVVQEGETLVGIARAYGLKAATLKSVNGLTDADMIRVGQELVLPLGEPAATRAPNPADTPVPSPAPTSTTSAGDAEALPSASSASAPTSPPPTAVPAAAPPGDLASWPRETVRLINDVRARHGLDPLVYNETLAQAAQGQANDCAQRGSCSHTGSDGSNIKTRVLRAGYAPTGWAECWAQRKTPQGAVDIWMDEVPPNDPHRRTLLTTWLTEIGVGVAEGNWGYYYFIADFGRP